MDPMPNRWVYELAREYGQSPGEVENWDPYHQNRALVLMQAETLNRRREQDRIDRARRKK